MRNKTPYFYTDKPLFGFDIGTDSLKVMQLEKTRKGLTIAGYGATPLDSQAFENGVIVKPKPIATAIRELFKHQLAGEITTPRIAMALPSYRTFSRLMQLPRLDSEELRQAVELEVEQYVPRPLQELYLDYTVTSQTADSCEVFVVATPKNIVDSHLKLMRALGLETISIEPAISACARLFALDTRNGAASVIIDFGSATADISIYDKTILATSTVAAGGNVFTEAIRRKLKLSNEEAGLIKTKYGLDVSPSQKDIFAALEPSLQKIVAEVRRMLRFYEERHRPQSKLEQVVMLGGGANMPGLADYLTNRLKVAVRTHNHPWATFRSPGLRIPPAADRLMYATAAGLCLIDPKEVFAP